ncbi:uncharacterized protein N7482_009952 [Penicillium canariense]|uniref:Mis12-Mtw1 family protein n=1 Tax=Penicillium canariense TaxID=189055 RepID=A0A9W9LG64_9EURO|nr:uncharacterized protein N7482_009952 [Penicillium canariense]KAJ5153474.1 hypothetical protein N7482_009952 [Penicillium canariense]
MTIAVLAAPTTKTKRREPLGTIGMAAFQAQSRPGPASSEAGRSGGQRKSKRLSATNHGFEEIMDHEGKRKAGSLPTATGYDEDADGFQFSRLPSKKSKPSVEPVPELAHSDVENAPPKPSPRRGRPPKKRVGEDIKGNGVPAKGNAAELPTRRPTRGAAKTTDAEPEPQLESVARSPRNGDGLEDQPLERKKKRGRPARPKTNETNGFQSPDQPPAGIKVALPMADTPVIQRNKDDLIDSGTSNALPHREVSTSDFYKHIADEGLPEPRRMRQLLIWCATRALGDKPSGSHSEDQSARLAARVIQDELLKDFSSNSDLSNWFSREEVGPPTVIVKKPNPRNIQNTDKIKELEAHIQKLQRERHALNALLKQPAITRIDAGPPKKSPKKSPRSKRQPEKSPCDEIDPSLLDPSQQAIYAFLNPFPSASPSTPKNTAPSTQPPMTPSTVSTRLSRITTGLAPTLDAFAAGIHDIELYRSSADAVSSRILRICAQRLEERDAENTQHWLALEGEDGELRPPRASSSRASREDLGLILGALSRVERR